MYRHGVNVLELYYQMTTGHNPRMSIRSGTLHCALSIIDVIITKSTRSEPKDIADINLCIGRVSTEDVLKRLADYYFGPVDDRVRKTIHEAFR